MCKVVLVCQKLEIYLAKVHREDGMNFIVMGIQLEKLDSAWYLGKMLIASGTHWYLVQ